jgi:uracil-DNA glycosylase
MNPTYDPGYCTEPFVTLASTYPDNAVYPSNQFRVEWGPIFHRGRLDGTARVLILGQDPAQHETIARRILVGEAGRRLQGFLAKLGIARSYVMINTFLYGVYGSVNTATRKGTALVAYRNQWLDALVAGGKIEAAIALGTAADEAWQLWKTTPTGAAANIPFAPITHPTQPESSSKGDKAKLADATKKLLANWNIALQKLRPSIHHPDQPQPLMLYGQTWANGDRIAVPAGDFPAGLPAWMHEQDGWAQRKGVNELAKRRNITLTVPQGIIP